MDERARKNDLPREVRVDGSSPFRNPFVEGRDGDRDRISALFAAWLSYNPHLARLVRRELAGNTLRCFCGNKPCHADALRRLANDASVSPKDPILVFGSNERGAHGKGAALHAARYYGAVAGVGEGPQGNAYAVPTKDASLRRLSINDIAENIDRFLCHARATENHLYDVTRVGCGLAGYADAEIAPLFAGAPPNCCLPWTWVRSLHPDVPARVIVAGSRGFNDYELLERSLDRLVEHLVFNGPIEIVSGAARGADTLAERFAIERGLRFYRWPADWTRFGKAAGMLRNQRMSWFGSHLVAYWNGASPGTRNMFGTAERDGLPSRVIRYQSGENPAALCYATRDGMLGA